MSTRSSWPQTVAYLELILTLRKNDVELRQDFCQYSDKTDKEAQASLMTPGLSILIIEDRCVNFNYQGPVCEF